MDEVGVEVAVGERRVELRVGERCICAVAREGYGIIVGGPLVAMSIGRVERSVAVYASARTGNVASDAIEPCETWRSCGDMPPNSAGNDAWAT